MYKLKYLLYPFMYLIEVVLIIVAAVGLFIITIAEQLAQQLPDDSWYTK